MDAREAIRLAAERAAGMGVVHKETSPVVETFNGDVIWQGIVHTFWSRECVVYVWGIEGEKETQYVTVLAQGKINSPIAAVRAWLVSEARKPK
jgi:hypothetical protein